MSPAWVLGAQCARRAGGMRVTFRRSMPCSPDAMNAQSGLRRPARRSSLQSPVVSLPGSSLNLRHPLDGATHLSPSMAEPRSLNLGSCPQKAQPSSKRCSARTQPKKSPRVATPPRAEWERHWLLSGKQLKPELRLVARLRVGLLHWLSVRRRRRWSTAKSTAPYRVISPALPIPALQSSSPTA